MDGSDAGWLEPGGDIGLDAGTVDRVPGWCRVLVGVAVWTSVLATVWASLVQCNVLAWIPAAATLCPLLAVRRGTFRVTCWVVAALIVVLAGLCVWFALFMHLPSALMLATAAVAADRTSRTLAKTAVIVGVLTGVIATTGWASGLYESLLAPPDAFIVETTPAFNADDRALLLHDGSGIGHGATSVSYSYNGGSGPTLYVHFRRDLSPGQRASLRRHLLSLPDVRRVYLRDRTRRDCWMG